MPTKKRTPDRWLCERLARNTVVVLKEIVRGHGVEPPEKISKKHLTWLAAGLVLNSQDTEKKRTRKRPPMAWYVLRVVPGKEGRVRRDVKRAAKVQFLDRHVGQILIARDGVIELRNGERVFFRRKSFRGYLLCRLSFAPDTFHLFDKVEHSMGFAPDRHKPMPVDESFMQLILDRHTKSARREVPKVKTGLKPGDRVTITDGAFADYDGVVLAVEGEGTASPVVKVEVKLLGRPTTLAVKPHQFTRFDS